MIQLHKKDQKILQELDVDARQATSRIAKKIGLSTESTNYRIKQLEKKGIIVGYYSLYNVALLGFNLYKIYIKLQNISKEKENEFIEYLSRIKQVGLIATSSGSYDLEIGVVARTLLAFHNILEQITREYGLYIKAKDVTTNIKMWQYNRKYLFEKEKGKIKEFYFFGQERSPTFDESDSKILTYLGSNARASNTDVGKALNISRKVVANRIKKLIENKIILGFRPRIDRDKLGLSYFRVLFKLQSIEERRVRQLFEYFKVHPNVVYVIKCIGPWEIEIEIEIDSSKACHDVILDIKHNFHDIISQSHIMEILKDYKYEFVLS